MGARGILQAQEYDLVVKFIPGKKNIVCNSSSIFCVNMTVNEADVGTKQRSDMFFGPIVKLVAGESDEILPNVDVKDYILHNNLLLKRIYLVRCGVDRVKYSLCVPDW